MSADVAFLKRQAAQLRMDAIDAIYHARSGHPGGSLSAADIVTALYFYRMRVDPNNPGWADRDRFVLSKGHASPILYAALARRGFFDIRELQRLRQSDSFLQGATSLKTPGIDMTSGPLGQGLSAAVGIALAGRYQKKDYFTYAMIGDGEMQEGQIWEACMAAAKFRLPRLVCFLDYNKVQMCGRNEEIMPIGNPAEKLKSFGWEVAQIDGHDMAAIVALLDTLDDDREGRPLFVVAHTIKGKGVSYMEDTCAWHGAVPDGAQYEQAMCELRRELA